METDAERLAQLEREGVTGEQWLRHHFTFFGNQGGAAEAGTALLRLGFDPVDADEEVAGDGYWHVSAFKVTPLQAEELVALRRRLNEVAERLLGNYTGWELARLGDGSLADPRRPLR